MGPLLANSTGSASGTGAPRMGEPTDGQAANVAWRLGDTDHELHVGKLAYPPDGGRNSAQFDALVIATRRLFAAHSNVGPDELVKTATSLALIETTRVRMRQESSGLPGGRDSTQDGVRNGPHSICHRATLRPSRLAPWRRRSVGRPPHKQDEFMEMKVDRRTSRSGTPSSWRTSRRLNRRPRSRAPTSYTPPDSTFGRRPMSPPSSTKARMGCPVVDRALAGCVGKSADRR